MEQRLNSIPILHVRGNHYECGFEMGRIFSSLIASFLNASTQLNEYFLPIYNSIEGKKVYNGLLKVVTDKFPHYVNEIKGIAEGAKVDFHKLMLFHFDEILANVTSQHKGEIESSGCSTVYFKTDNSECLGHTEDAHIECLNTFYIVSMHIVSDVPYGKFNITEEKFTSLCYPGHLPGYTMGYNSYGLVFTVNTLRALNLVANKMPRHFITRALLTARNYDEAMEILKDEGVGLADGCSINMKFISAKTHTNFFNIELGPDENGEKKSKMEVLEAVGIGSMIHCNHYLRLNVPQYDDPQMEGTKMRYETLKSFPEPKQISDVTRMLGDKSHVSQHFIFRPNTVCVGIFDFINRTWSLYKDNPKTNKPLAILHLEID